MHELLMQLTKELPMKIILIDDEPYLERYYVGKDSEGKQLWLHRILRGDPERWMHTHPFNCISTILVGWYKEYRAIIVKDGALSNQPIFIQTYKAGSVNVIKESTLHRIVEAEPNTWSYLVVDPGRKSTWKFLGEDGAEVVMNSSSEDWHMEHGNRDEEYVKLRINNFTYYTSVVTKGIDNSLTIKSSIEFTNYLVEWDRLRENKSEADKDLLLHGESFQKMTWVLPKQNLCKSTLGVLSDKPKLEIYPEPDRVNTNKKRIPFCNITIGVKFKTTTGAVYIKIADREYRAANGGSSRIYYVGSDRLHYRYEVVI